MIKRVSFFSMSLENFFSEIESIILAFEFQRFCKEWVSTVKHCYFSMIFVFYFLKNLFPVGSTSLGLRSQPSSYISVFLWTYYTLLGNNRYFRIRAKYCIYDIKEYHNHTFLCKMSIAVWSANALRVVLLSAAVRYMCTSKNLWWPASSPACSSSIWFSSLMNHSNDFWSRFIQKKSTLIEKVKYAVNCIIYKKIFIGLFWYTNLTPLCNLECQTFFKLWDDECVAMSSFHFQLHFGHSLLMSLYRCIRDCRMDENGVTPIPVAINTACSARKMLLAGAPKGPSIKICKM